ncbi:hypothetical protein V2G26_006537 [Clonostachys chloroleuca]
MRRSESLTFHFPTLHASVVSWKCLGQSRSLRSHRPEGVNAEPGIRCGANLGTAMQAAGVVLAKKNHVGVAIAWPTCIKNQSIRRPVLRCQASNSGIDCTCRRCRRAPRTNQANVTTFPAI